MIEKSTLHSDLRAIGEEENSEVCAHQVNVFGRIINALLLVR